MGDFLNLGDQLWNRSEIKKSIMNINEIIKKKAKELKTLIFGRTRIKENYLTNTAPLKVESSLFIKFKTTFNKEISQANEIIGEIEKEQSENLQKIKDLESLMGFVGVKSFVMSTGKFMFKTVFRLLDIFFKPLKHVLLWTIHNVWFEGKESFRYSTFVYSLLHGIYVLMKDLVVTPFSFESIIDTLKNFVINRMTPFPSFLGIPLKVVASAALAFQNMVLDLTLLSQESLDDVIKDGIWVVFLRQLKMAFGKLLQKMII